MFRVDTITKDWKEAGSFPAQLNLYGFWDEYCFLTKTGDLGAVLKIGGIDYESLDHAGLLCEGVPQEGDQTAKSDCVE